MILISEQAADSIAAHARSLAGKYLSVAGESTEQLILFSQFLPPFDRKLVQAVLVHGQSVTTLARLLGRRRLKVNRRFLKLVARITSRRYRLAVAGFLSLDRRERRLAREWIFAGWPVRQLAAVNHQSVHQVRVRQELLMGKLSSRAATPAATAAEIVE